MKIGVVGLGSMGKRRVRDLGRLGCQVVGFDSAGSRRREAAKLFGIRTLATFESLVKAGVEAVVISTPPDAHAHYYDRCFSARLPFFSEAGIFTPKLEWFTERERASGVKGFPSATWQFHPIFSMAREAIAGGRIGPVQSVHYHYGGYLPSWHPWEDYTEYYAGRKKTAAAREMVPFELEWLTFVFGPVESVGAVKGQLGHWKAEFDDSYFLHLAFASGLRGTLNIELHQTAPFRFGIISGRDGALKLDMLRPELQQYDLRSDSWRMRGMPGIRVMNSFNFEDVYFREIEAFFLAVSKDRTYPKTWAEDRHLSDVLFAAETSAREGRVVRIADVSEAYAGLTL